MTKKHANRQKKSLPAEQAETKELEAHEEYGQVMHSRMDNLFSDLDQMVGDDKTDPVAARLETPNLERAHDDDRIELILPSMASSELEQPSEVVDKEESDAPATEIPELEQPLEKDDKLESATPAMESPETEQSAKVDAKEEPDPQAL
ncbi:MAG: hypothetical protein QGD96_10000, partial [Anaerolineae bacterium]|nr:hypothetical protein [Anaerolineae bacterium]